MMLSTDLERGGLPMRLVRLAVRLRQDDVEPVVGCLAPRGPLSDELESAGIETFACDAGSQFDLACLLRLGQHIRRIDPDLIHSSLFHANLAARLVGRLDRPRPIVTSTVTIEIERGWHRLLESLTSGLSDVHVANSQAVARHLRADLGFPPQRVAVVPNGVAVDDIDRIPPIQRHALGIKDSVPLVVWAGRMDPVKDLTTFVEVIIRASAQMPVQAVLLGDGPERPRIQSLIESRHLDSVMRLSGWSDNVIGWLKAADLLLFPSLTEGSPNVVIEAMACKCPVVASDVPSCRELIDSGKHGWLCRAGDVECFARLVTDVLRDDHLRLRAASLARQRVAERHDLQDVVHRWLAIYERLMPASARSH